MTNCLCCDDKQICIKDNTERYFRYMRIRTEGFDFIECPFFVGTYKDKKCIESEVSDEINY